MDLHRHYRLHGDPQHSVVQALTDRVNTEYREIMAEANPPEWFTEMNILSLDDAARILSKIVLHLRALDAARRCSARGFTDAANEFSALSESSNNFVLETCYWIDVHSAELFQKYADILADDWDPFKFLLDAGIPLSEAAAPQREDSSTQGSAKKTRPRDDVPDEDEPKAKYPRLEASPSGQQSDSERSEPGEPQQAAEATEYPTILLTPFIPDALEVDQEGLDS
jgi:hypothetical protein